MEPFPTDCLLRVWGLVGSELLGWLVRLRNGEAKFVIRRISLCESLSKVKWSQPEPYTGNLRVVFWIPNLAQADHHLKTCCVCRGGNFRDCGGTVLRHDCVVRMW